MRLTAKSQHAVTAMLDLACHEDKGPRPLAAISRDLGMSVSYLEQMFAALRDKGLVTGTRGPGGGYCLDRDLDRISIADIICAVDDWVDYQQAIRKHGNESVSRTTARRIWNDLSRQLFDLTAEITLYELLNTGAPSQTAGRNNKARATVAPVRKLAVRPKRTA